MKLALQKFYSKTLGERDYGIFEATYLGMRLPLIFPLLPVVSLNTSGTRQLRKITEPLIDDDDKPITLDSKLDLFEKRRHLILADDKCKVTQEEVRWCSWYEFACKYNVFSGRVRPAKTQVCFMLTPSFAATTACVSHPRHEAYARSTVVAFWRLMPTDARQQLADVVYKTYDSRRNGASKLVEPACPDDEEEDGQPRFLGVQDLVHLFDQNRRFGWDMALLEFAR